jgi:D-alanine-D-alanine ligase
MRVVVLGGGRSSEHEVSLASAAAVAEGLRAGGHDVATIEIDRAGVWRSDGAELELRPAGGLLGADAVFPALHGPYGEDGTVQGLLECLDVPYVGAGVAASALCIDKLTFKDLMGQAGLPQVGYVAVTEARWREDRAAQREDVLSLGLPMFVKAARLGSSVGIAKVTQPEELDAAIEQALVHDPRVIAEAFSDGLEVECSILDGETATVSELGEIVIKGDWYDYEAKYTEGGMELVVPARIEPAARVRVRELALEAFARSGCAGLARADFFVCGGGDGERDVLLNELNTMPGFTPTSVYARLFEASGVPYVELLDRLVSDAIARHDAARVHQH